MSDEATTKEVKTSAVKAIDFPLLVKGATELGKFLEIELQTARVKKPSLAKTFLETVLKVPEEREGSLPQEVFDSVSNIQAACNVTTISEAIDVIVAEVGAAAEPVKRVKKDQQPKPPKVDTGSKARPAGMKAVSSRLVEIMIDNPGIASKEVFEKLQSESYTPSRAGCATDYNICRKVLLILKERGILPQTEKA